MNEQQKNGGQPEILTNNRYASLIDADEDVAMVDGIDVGVNTSTGIGANSSSDVIIKKISDLENEIVESNRCIGSNANKRAKEMLNGRMKKTGQTSNVALSKLYDEMYREELGRIQDLKTRKQLLEVHLFISLNIPLSDELKNEWTDEMLEYFFKLKNGGVKDQAGASCSEAMMDEIAEDTSAHAGFMTQNNVSNVVDAQMQSGIASNNSVV